MLVDCERSVSESVGKSRGKYYPLISLLDALLSTNS